MGMDPCPQRKQFWLCGFPVLSFLNTSGDRTFIEKDEGSCWGQRSFVILLLGNGCWSPCMQVHASFLSCLAIPCLGPSRLNQYGASRWRFYHSEMVVSSRGQFVPILKFSQLLPVSCG